MQNSFKKKYYLMTGILLILFIIFSLFVPVTVLKGTTEEGWNFFLVTIYCFSYKIILSPFLYAEVTINLIPYIVLTILRVILFVAFIFILRKEKNFYYKVFIYILIDIILVLLTSYFAVGYRFVFGLNDITDTEGNLSYFLFLYLIYYIFVFLLPFLLLKKNYPSNK